MNTPWLTPGYLPKKKTPKQNIFIFQISCNRFLRRLMSHPQNNQLSGPFNVRLQGNGKKKQQQNIKNETKMDKRSFRMNNMP